MAKFLFIWYCHLLLGIFELHKEVRIVTNKYISNKKVLVLIGNVHFRIPQENWHLYPAWLILYIHVIIAPAIGLSAIAMKILMKNEMKRFLFGNSVYPVHK